jgi:hypothetical protein
MAQPNPIPDLRRIVTTHDDKGIAIVGTDSEISAEVRALWTTSKGPTCSQS